jgi:hypothetical protein
MVLRFVSAEINFSSFGYSGYPPGLQLRWVRIFSHIDWQNNKPALVTGHLTDRPHPSGFATFRLRRRNATAQEHAQEHLLPGESEKLLTTETWFSDERPRFLQSESA